MRHLILAAILGSAVAGVQASESTKAVVGSYLEIQAALAADKIDAVKPAAKTLAGHAAKLGSAGEPIVKAAKAVESAADIKATRTAFGELSDAVIAAAKADGWADLPDVKVAYCPMAKKSWLQTGEKIQNPYYGSAMLTCGEFKPR